MTDREIIRALRICSRRTDAQTCAECPLFDSEDSEDCMGDMMVGAADLIERLEKERNALLEAANSRKLCEICKNDSYCFDARCTENTCDDCYQYRVCPCSNCLSHPKFEWKGLENAL